MDIGIHFVFDLLTEEVRQVEDANSEVIQPNGLPCVAWRPNLVLTADINEQRFIEYDHINEEFNEVAYFEPQ